MKLKNLILYFLSILLVSSIFLFISCGTKSMMITVKRPAKVNLKDYNKIAIGDFTDQNGEISNHSRDFTEHLTTTLFSSEYFEVLDRNHLNSIMKEHELNIEGFIDESTASKLGEFVGAAVLLFGRIQTDKYNEELTKGKKWVDDDGEAHQSFYRTGKYKVSINVKLTDIQSGRIVAAKNISSKTRERNSADMQYPAEIDEETLYSKCLKDISNQFMKLVAPYEVKVKAKFETDKMLPEIDQAITQFKIDEWEEGVKLIREATEKSNLESDVQAKAFYDLGLAQMYGGDPKSAIENFKKAMELNPSSKKYQNAIIKAKEEKKKSEQLEEQL